MAIQYALIENKLAAGPNRYLGRVRHRATVTIEDVIDQIARPGSTITTAEALAFWEELSQAIVSQVQAGYRFRSNLFGVSLTLTGNFHSAQDMFDASRHQLRVRVAPGMRLRQAGQGLRLELVPAASTGPRLESFEDFGSDTHNARLTPGNMARLQGQRLKLDPADAQQGIFLVAADGTATKVGRVVTNRPAEQLFLVPPTLLPGSYRLELRRCGKDSVVLQTGSLAAALTVA